MFLHNEEVMILRIFVYVAKKSGNFYPEWNIDEIDIGKYKTDTLTLNDKSKKY